MERLEALTPDELATLARLTTAATNVGDGEWYGPDDEAVLFAVDWKEDAAFIAYCTPGRIARLVEAASAGAEDTARLDDVLDEVLVGLREPMTPADAERVRTRLTRVHVARKKARVLASRAASPTSTETATE